MGEHFVYEAILGSSAFLGELCRRVDILAALAMRYWALLTNHFGAAGDLGTFLNLVWNSTWRTCRHDHLDRKFRSHLAKTRSGSWILLWILTSQTMRLFFFASSKRSSGDGLLLGCSLPWPSLLPSSVWELNDRDKSQQGFRLHVEEHEPRKAFVMLHLVLIHCPMSLGIQKLQEITAVSSLWRCRGRRFCCWQSPRLCPDRRSLGLGGGAGASWSAANVCTKNIVHIWARIKRWYVEM